MLLFRPLLWLCIATLCHTSLLLAETYHGIVTKVIDGDTLRVDIQRKNIKVRLIGIDALEKIDNPKAQKDAERLHQSEFVARQGGIAARNYLSTLLAPGDPVTLETDRTEYDQYGRTLAYVFDKQHTFINQKLIADGYAGLLIYAPNDSRAAVLSQAFDEAKQQQRGLWKQGLHLTYRWKR
jgi:endonuclease YncB( thermonuclease family)